MTFEQIFRLFYTKYRGEESPPGAGDPEWEIAISNYNDATQRMLHFDDTKWNFLWQSLQVATSGTAVVTLGTSTYDAPDDMAEPGGVVSLIDPESGARTNLRVVNPYEAQVITKAQPFAYFTGDQSTGFVLNLNPVPDSNWDGMLIDYTYYRKPVLLETTEDGSTVIEGGDPSFYYNHMLAQRFMDSRNFSAYQVAKRDAEEALKGMKLKNNSGSHYNAWTTLDTGGGWGI